MVSELLKFDPETLVGEREKIEQRNPAFDVTPNRYISGLICEEGIIAPQSVVEVVRRKYSGLSNFDSGSFMIRKENYKYRQ